ncbi:DgyrCDS8831 [Dimorphilus gyrociliatus]|uniref:DgyrCDS8831 n=1 Tax=Dimorphilus gyrociliatus TaxID=2664684 RepID=A0A7I8VV90_9ANNE|nr:DgyrCDS8831 [Dimorphilus gyrociliatus]
MEEGGVKDENIKQVSLKDTNNENRIFLVWHVHDSEMGKSVQEHLESTRYGFKCFNQDDLFHADPDLSLAECVVQGVRNSAKTIFIISSMMLTDLWAACELEVLPELNFKGFKSDFMLLIVQEVELPFIFTDVFSLNASTVGWWNKLINWLTPTDSVHILSTDTNRNSPGLAGVNPALQSGHLLLSYRSRCGCCGREQIESELPEELMAHGLQIPNDEYAKAISNLMQSFKARCHLCCFSAPAAAVFFTSFFVLCLTIIPFVEVQLFVSSAPANTGLEYIHGCLIWLTSLSFYLVVSYLSRRRMNRLMAAELSSINSIFVRHNVLIGMEDLSIADCNKYYVSFLFTILRAFI